MTPSQNHAPITSPHPAWGDLIEFLEARRRSRQPVSDWEAFETELHRRFAAAEAEVIGQELQRLDIDAPAVEIDGVVHRQVLRCEETYVTCAGEVRIMRSLYSTRQGDERAVCPMELRAGLVEGRYTPLAAKQATWVVAHLVPQEGEELFRLLGGMQPSKASLDRLPKALSKRWEEGREAFEEALRAHEQVPKEAVTVSISLDGVMAPMKDGQRAQRRQQAKEQGKKTRGPAGYQEVGCATLSLYDAEGNRLRTVRLGRMPEPKKAALKQMLHQELAAVLEQRPDLQVVKVADGAKDNWRYLSGLPVAGIPVADFYHAAEHLHAALCAAYGEASPKGQAQFEKLRHLLRHDDDGVDKVIRALCHLRDQHPRSKKIATELGYFRHNRHRMRYAELAGRNLPIGSGVVEAACKTLVTQRMKRSGMRWRHEGGQAILTFRALAQSERFDLGWLLLAGTYRRTVSLPENIVSLADRRPR
jgi:hypothetical protein